jgi:hypothetical protein
MVNGMLPRFGAKGGARKWVFAALLLAVSACSHREKVECVDVMQRDGMMFRICESPRSVTVEQLGPATPEQRDDRTRLRLAARENGLNSLLRGSFTE